MKRIACGACLLLCACASTSPDGSFHAVQNVVADRTGHRLQWNREAPEDRAVDKAVQGLLAKEIGVEQAVQIALLKNPSLHVVYEELSISQADLVQAGLLRNPVIGVGMTTAEGDRLDPNLLVSAAWDFLDLLTLAARKKIASAQVEATRLRVADAVLDLAFQVKAAFYELQGAMQVAAMRGIVLDSATASAELAERQHESGNINDLTLANQESIEQQFELDFARANSDVVEKREVLTRLLGLWGPDANYRISPRLPELPKEEPPLEHLESLAIAERLDLAALRKERDVLGMNASYVASTRFTPGIGIGAEAGRLNDGHISVAPRADVELPIFDQKQGQIAHARALFRAADERMRARAIEIRSEVRAAQGRLAFARRALAHYQGEIIPTRERIVLLSQEQYDAMLLGVYQLLAAKRSEVDAYRESIEAARDYWLARIELEKAVGGRLHAPANAPPPAQPSKP